MQNIENSNETSEVKPLVANGQTTKGVPVKLESGEKGEKEYTLNTYRPTGADWLAHFTRGIDRMAEIFNGHKEANDLASRVKADFALVEGVSKVKNPSPARMESARKTVRKVLAGEVFDLRDYVAKDGRDAKEERVVLSQENYTKLHGAIARWDSFTPEQRGKLVAVIASLKVAFVVKPEGTQEEALAAFEAGAKAPDMVDLDALLGM
jgi:hypothetical protein